MYYCSECEQLFEDDNDLLMWGERSEFWGIPYTSYDYLCPNCRNPPVPIKEYHLCDNCGKLCIYDFIHTKDNNYYCSDCYEITNIDE